MWRHLEELIKHVITPTEIMVTQIAEGHNPREPIRKARVLRAERQNSYETKLTNLEWTPTRFLEAAAHLYAKLPMPTDEEVEDYEFRLQVEAEENGDDEDDDNDGSDNDGETDDTPEEEQPVQEEVTHANRCKVCLDGVANVFTLPCKHMAMCERCTDLLRDDRCPICRTTIASKFNVFLS